MQYVHTLICTDPVFAPAPEQVVAFFETLVSSFGFRVLIQAPFQTGFLVLKHTGRLGKYTNGWTGEEKTFPALDRFPVESFSDFSPLIDGLNHYSASASGAWSQADSPLFLLTGDGKPFEADPICLISCELRPKPVSTAFWAVLDPCPLPDVPPFDATCPSSRRMGIFSHPWTGKPIYVPDAGCSRFRIEFQFGKLLAPKMKDSLDLMPLALVAAAQRCFGPRFAQGYYFL
jgi:hypothetical protein